MPHQFSKHYTIEEARKLLPQVRKWLEDLQAAREALEQKERRLKGSFQPGTDTGGKLVNEWVRALAQIKEGLQKFEDRQIQLKDIERGLLDFPAIIGGKEVFLCWEKGEEDIEFWHDLDTGYAGREHL
jgi:hypothetical protein